MNPNTRWVRLSASIVDAVDTFIESATPGFVAERDIERGYCKLTLSELRELIETAATCHSSREPLSIQLLRYMPVTAAGDVGVASMTAETLGEALDTGIRFLPLVLDLFDCHKRVSGNEERVEMRCRHDLGATCNAVLMEVHAGLFGNMAFFARHAPRSDGNTRYVMRLAFSHEPQGDAEAYRKMFGAVPDFNQPNNYFAISRQILRQPLLTANRATHIALKENLEEQLYRYGITQSISDRLRTLVWKSLVEESVLTSDELASRLCMSTRTLGRRLEEESTNVRLLINQTRLEYAKHLIQTTGLPVASVAKKAGYSNPSSFSRAFSRYFGVPPGQHRL